MHVRGRRGVDIAKQLKAESGPKLKDFRAHLEGKTPASIQDLKADVRGPRLPLRAGRICGVSALLPSSTDFFLCMMSVCNLLKSLAETGAGVWLGMWPTKRRGSVAGGGICPRVSHHRVREGRHAIHSVTGTGHSTR